MATSSNPNCLVEWVPPPTTTKPTKTFAKRCIELRPHYTAPIIDCDKIYTTWDGEGEADIYEWHLGKWHNVQENPTGTPIWQFETIELKFGKEIIFTCIPEGDWAIVLVAKVGNCPNSYSTQTWAGSAACIPCGQTSVITTATGTPCNCTDCCIKQYDACNIS